MAAFNLTAQLQLQAPGNVRQVVSAIRKQLAPIGVQVNVVGNSRSLAQINSQLQNTSKYAKDSARSVGELNRTLQESARRFSVITLATGTLLGFASAVKNSVREAIDFEKSLVNLSQITGKTVQQLKPLSDEVTRLSTTFGTSSKELIDAAQVLAQAGFSAEMTRKSLDVLAKTTLAASFGNIKDTTEGVIASLSQFTDAAASTASKVDFLQSTLDAINAVSKAFAVESSDLITVIRRTGGVFAAAGGSVEELIALFTSVRATTRESAETIATGLRTIFSRIQRPETIALLKQLGIELQDSQGKFIGAFEAVKRLSAGLASLDPKDFRFAAIVEQLGGFRQVGKVIPLIQQFAIAQDALNVAQSSSGALAKDAEIAQLSLANQIQKVREEFDALIRKFVDSSSFRSVAGGALELAKAFIKIADALEPVLPLLTSLFALKLGSGIAPAIASFAGVGAKVGGAGRVSKFASGGLVPGSGNRDTVPAMLTPGEFVIKKSSVNKMGAGTLHAMNQNKYAAGGQVVTVKPTDPSAYGVFTLIDGAGTTVASNGQGVNNPALSQKVLQKMQSKDTQEYDVTGGIRTKGQDDPQKLLKEKDFRRYVLKQQNIKGTGDQVKAGLKAIPQDKILELRENYNKSQAGDLAENTKKRLALSSKIKPEDLKVKVQGPFPVAQIQGAGQKGETRTELSGDFADAARNGLKSAITQIAKSKLIEDLKIPPIKPDEGKLYSFNNLYEGAQETLEGYLLEGVTGALTNAKIEGGGANFDFASFTGAAKERLSKLYSPSSIIPPLQKADAKRSKSAADSQNSFANKVAKDLGEGGGNFTIANIEQAQAKRKASGGSISGGDTVPALLTPGEFVVNKKAASRIGYGNLHRMNKSGVAGFASGGIVGVQKFAAGGKAQSAFGGGGSGLDLTKLGLSQTTLKQLDAAAAKSSAEFTRLSTELAKYGDNVSVAKAALTRFGANVAATGSPANAFAQALDTAKAAFQIAGKNVMNASSKTDTFLQTGLSTKNLMPTIARMQGSGSFADLKKQVDIGGGQTMSMTGLARGAGLQTMSSASGAEMKTMEANLKQAFSNIGASGKDLATAMGVARKELTDGKNTVQAFSTALGVLAKQTPPPTTPQARQLGTVKDFGKGFAGGMQNVQGVAQAAQNVVFLGASVTALTGQMSGLSDATKQTINETAGFAIAITGIGSTLVSTFSSFFTSNGQSAAAQQQLAGAATNASTALQGLATKASGTSVPGAPATPGATGAAGTAGTKLEAAGGALAAGLGAAVASVILVTTVMKAFSASFKAEADQIKKSSEQMIKQFKEDGTGLDTSTLQKNIKDEVDLRQKSIDVENSMTTAGAAAAAGALAAAGGAAAAGAALGSTVPIVGTVIGALAGLAVGYYLYSSAQAEAAKKQEELNKKLDAAVSSYIAIISATQKFESALKDIDLTNIGEQEKVNRRLQASQELGNQPLVSGTNAINQIKDLALSMAPEKMKTSGGLTEADFKDVAANAELLKISQKSLAEANETAAKKTVESRNTLARAGKLEMMNAARAGKTFADLANGGTAYSTALKDTISSIEQEFSLKIAQVQVDKAILQAKIASATTDKEKEQLGKALAALDKQEIGLKQRQISQTNDVTNADKLAFKAAEDMVKQEKIAAAAAAALADELNAATQLGVALSRLSDSLDQQANAIETYSAILNNQALKIQGPKVEEISNPAEVKDRDKFNNQVRTVTNRFGAEGKKLASKLEQQGRFYDKANKELQDPRIGQLGESIDPTKVLDSLGLNEAEATKIFGARGKEIFEDMKQKLSKAAADTRITPEEISDILKPVKDQMEAEAKNVEKMSELIQKELDNYSGYLKNLEDYRNKELEQDAKVSSAMARAADIMSAATGIRSDIGMRETARTKAGQSQLNISGAGAAGARAGNLSSLQAVKSSASAEMERTAAIARDTTLETKTRKAAMAQYEQQRRIVESVNKELERLGDQSERVADLQSGIEAERGKREAISGILEEFVTGGEEQRDALNRSFSNIAQSISTGTLQNQPPEQRKETIALLDKLKDIPIAQAGGLTGKQVKQELLFRDAIRMGFPPDLAKNIATSTTKEEELISALDKLTQTIVASTNAANAPTTSAPVEPAPLFFKGGRISYLDKGGKSVFKPKGTDTIPAMLSPGEFVVRKSAVDKVGIDTLNNINNGNATVYRQFGGPVGGAINASNVMGNKVNIMSGDQYLSVLYDAIRKKPTQFLGFFRNAGYKKEAVALGRLIKSGRFDPSRLTMGRDIARALDTFRGKSQIFEIASATDLKLKSPDVNDLLNPKTFGNYKLMIDRVDKFINDLSDLTWEGLNRNNPGFSFVWNKFGEIQDKIIKQSGNMPVGFMLQYAMDKIQDVINGLLEAKNRGREGINRIPPPINDDTLVDSAFNAFLGTSKNISSDVGMTKEDYKESKLKAPKKSKKEESLQEDEAFLKQSGVYFNKGGYVSYYDRGGSIFKPKGTDTVPAMLTPGEFVIKKSSVDKIGVENLQAINQGRGAVYANTGGLISYFQNAGLAQQPNDMLTSEEESYLKLLDVFSKRGNNFSKKLKVTFPIKGNQKELTSYELIDFIKSRISEIRQYQQKQNIKESIIGNIRIASADGTPLWLGDNLGEYFLKNLNDNYNQSQQQNDNIVAQNALQDQQKYQTEQDRQAELKRINEMGPSAKAAALKRIQQPETVTRSETGPGTFSIRGKKSSEQRPYTGTVNEQGQPEAIDQNSYEARYRNAQKTAAMNVLSQGPDEEQKRKKEGIIGYTGAYDLSSVPGFFKSPEVYAAEEQAKKEKEKQDEINKRRQQSGFYIANSLQKQLGNATTKEGKNAYQEQLDKAGGYIPPEEEKRRLDALNSNKKDVRFLVEMITKKEQELVGMGYSQEAFDYYRTNKLSGLSLNEASYERVSEIKQMGNDYLVALQGLESKVSETTGKYSQAINKYNSDLLSPEQKQINELMLKDNEDTTIYKDRIKQLQKQIQEKGVTQPIPIDVNSIRALFEQNKTDLDVFSAMAFAMNRKDKYLQDDSPDGALHPFKIVDKGWNFLASVDRFISMFQKQQQQQQKQQTTDKTGAVPSATVEQVADSPGLADLPGAQRSSSTSAESTGMQSQQLSANFDSLQDSTPREIIIDDKDKNKTLYANNPLTVSKGGYISYFAKGGSIFKPKGTDTVPAMLSPGEFVIRKSSVDKYGTETLAKVNNGELPRFADGGLVSYFGDGGAGSYKSPAQRKQELDERKRQRIEDKKTAIAERQRAREAAIASNPLAESRQRQQQEQQQQQQQQQQRQNAPQQLLQNVQAGAVGLEALQGAFGQQGIAQMFGQQMVPVVALLTQTQKYLAGQIKTSEGNIINAIQAGGGAGAAAPAAGAGAAPVAAGAGAFGGNVAVKARGGLIPSYLYNGGGTSSLSSKDTIPAMLTPGEFVMNNKAVKKYGVNAMQRLNKGQFEGFNKGGFVGGGSVIYKADGGEVGAKTNIGTLTVDGSGLQNIFNTFSNNFTGIFDPLASTFDGLVKTISGIAEKISKATVTFQQNITGSIKIEGVNVESLREGLKNAMTDHIKTIFNEEFENRKNDFQSGG